MSETNSTEVVNLETFAKELEFIRDQFDKRLINQEQLNVSEWLLATAAMAAIAGGLTSEPVQLARLCITGLVSMRAALMFASNVKLPGDNTPNASTPPTGGVSA